MYTEHKNEGIYLDKEVRVPTFTMTYEHVHDYCEIFYLKSGNCIYSIKNALYHLSAGDLFIVAPGDSHCTRYEGSVPCERIVLSCRLDSIPKEFQEKHPTLITSLSHSGKVIFSKKICMELEHLLKQMLNENNIPDEYSFDFLQHQLVLLLLWIQRNGIFVYEQIDQTKEISFDIEKALRYIALNFSLPLKLEDVAREINLSPTYLSKKFKKITGLTFTEYVNFIRIRQACQMLLTTDGSITQIALNCGFNSSNYFKDCFRKINGVSPRTFRMQSKKQAFDFETVTDVKMNPLDIEKNNYIDSLYQNLS